MLFGRKQKNPIQIADVGVSQWKYTIEAGLHCDAPSTLRQAQDRPSSGRTVT